MAEPRFPHAISVQRLAPQVQRQIRETQELIKDSCPQLYAAGYGSPGPPPMRSLQQQQQQQQQHMLPQFPAAAAPLQHHQMPLQQQQQLRSKRNMEHYSQELS